MALSYAPFTCRACRIVSWVVSIILILGMTALVAYMPENDMVNFGPGSIALTALLTLAACALQFRIGYSKAVPNQEGLFVRNIVRKHFIAWQQVVVVNSANPQTGWVHMDLSDGSTVPVMAIQHISPSNKKETVRLATLVAFHSGHYGPDSFESPPNSIGPEPTN